MKNGAAMQMNFNAIDWEQIWRQAKSESSFRGSNTDFWDRRAPCFSRAAAKNDYSEQFIGIISPQPHWTVLDVGCGAGTLAIPMASSVSTVTAMDFSDAMLDLLQKQCNEKDIANIRIVKGAWEDDWHELGIEIHDLVIASRSFVMKDIRNAVLKLNAFARERVCISAFVDSGPFDRELLKFIGRDFKPGQDYIYLYNFLRQTGHYVNVRFTVHKQHKTYADHQEAADAVRWMLDATTPEETEKLLLYLESKLIRKNGGWQMPCPHIVRWAVMWWEKE